MSDFTYQDFHDPAERIKKLKEYRRMKYEKQKKKSGKKKKGTWEDLYKRLYSDPEGL